jgi:hypothetical protein
MSGGTQSRSSKRGSTLLPILAVALLPFVIAPRCPAQVNGVPPSVTSIQYHTPPFMPNVRPSVTSLGPYGFGHAAGTIPAPYGLSAPLRRQYGNGHRTPYGYGATYAVPYYVPVYDTSAGYDSGGGPYLYSGPPAEQTLHIVVDLPAKRAVAEDDEVISRPAVARKSNAMEVPDAQPVDPTVLVFRDGHQQEVSNYAIMGQTVYIFDSRTQKIALADLDVAATIKVNDDRGVEFHIPAHTKS